MRIAVIPAYEPEKETFHQVLAAAQEAGFRILVVDDGSGPRYAETFREARQYAHVIGYPENRGKGHALKTAFSYILDTCGGQRATVVTLDCDGQHKIADAVRVCETVEVHPGAMVLGSRRLPKTAPRKSRLGNGVTRVVFRMMTGFPVRDTQTGLRAFDASFLPLLLEIPGERYEYEMNVLLRLAQAPHGIIEVPIETIYIRNNAGSHFRALRDSVSVYAEIVKFSASSFLGFLTDYALYSLIVLLAGAKGVIAANVLARVVSATVNFRVNHKFVFSSEESLFYSACKYFALACAVLIGNSALLYLLVVKGGCNPFVSKIAVELTLFFVSWFVQRTFVFKRRAGKRARRNA